MDTISAYTTSNRKIDPSRRPRSKPDGSPDENDRVEIGPTALAFEAWAKAGLEAPNLEAMRQYRLQRIVGELRKHDYAGLLCFDPLNIRYVTDTTNMQLWVTHNPSRACFVSADGYVVLWDYANCGHLSAHLPLVREVRTGASFFYFVSGERVGEHAARFAAEIDDLLKSHGGGNRRLAIDRIEPEGLMALRGLGIETFQGQVVTELARAIKGPDDVKALKCAVQSCEIAMHQMQRELRSGMSENDLWSILHAENIRHGGEWIETRILASGPRTNPWFQECGPRIIQDGDIVAFDTDLIGVYGMCCDISRTWLCGDGEPTQEQKRVYRHAHEQVHSNLAMLRPGMGFKEFTEKANLAPQEFRHNRYGVLAHGVGLCDEYPSLYFPEDYPSTGYDGVFEPGMAICVESYCGTVGGSFGVKLEQQVLITETGTEDITTYPYESRFLD
ncbi:MAG: aminopeptidase P family protein [Nitratireductor sp.]|nr:aminopeptidase P family protein [Nitratireductor sp.]